MLSAHEDVSVSISRYDLRGGIVHLARLLTWFFNSCKNIRITLMVILSPTLASDPSRTSSLVPTPVLHQSELCNFLAQRLHLDHANAGVLQPSLCIGHVS